MSGSARNVVHLLPWYAPESWGGTEQYVLALATELSSANWGTAVVAPSASGKEAAYDFGGIAVRRYLPGATNDDAAAFVDLLRELRADILHLHCWTPDCGAPQLSAANNAGFATVVTVHIPGTVCARGSLMYLGQTPCVRVNSPRRCAKCWMDSHGVPTWVASCAAVIPDGLSLAIRRRIKGRIGWVPGARGMMQQRFQTFARDFNQADRVVVVCDWLRRIVGDLGVDKERTVLCRQGLDRAWLAPKAHSPVRRKVFTIAFVGRWERGKGIHLLTQAVLSLPKQMQVSLQMALPAPTNAEAKRYRAEVLDLCANDSRVDIREGLPRDEVRTLVSSAHVVAIPSQWLETGPLIALEARSLGTFVLASDLGGLSELLAGDAGARLLPFDDIGRWRSALVELHERRDQLALGFPKADVRTSADVAQEMQDVYASALNRSAARRRA